MTAIFASLVFGLPRIVEIAAETAFKAAILCLAVLLLHFLVGRKRLLLRSALWHICLIGLLLLPIAVIALPRLHVATPFAAVKNHSHQQASNELDTHTGAAEVIQNVTNGADNSLQVATSVAAPNGEAPKLEAGAGAAPLQLGFRRLGEIALLAVLAVYLLTLAILLVRLCVSLLAVAALRRRSMPVVHVDWRQSLDRWRSQLGLRPRVQLCQADSVSVPVVVGWRRPTIVLPPELVEKADPQVIDAVLLHELTHVQRGDYAWNLVLRIVRAVYWPHPCVWFVSHFVSLGREAVCDAVCVHWMGNVRAYRTVLVDVAAALTPQTSVAVGMAMASSSKLGRRLARVEQSPDMKRGLLASPVRIGVAGVVIVAAGLLGSAQLAARVAAGENAGGQAELATAQADFTVDAQDPPSQEPASNAPKSAGRSGPAPNDQKPDEAASAEPLRVKTVKVKRGTLEKVIVSLTYLEATGQISIPAKTAGVIAKAFVEVGDQVKAGDVLAELEIPDIAAERTAKEALVRQAQADREHAGINVAAAEATVESKVAAMTEAEAELKRATAAEAFQVRHFQHVKKLFDTKVIGEDGLDEQKEEVQTAGDNKLIASAKLDSAKAALSRSKLEVQLARTSVESAAVRVAAAKQELSRITAMTEKSALLIHSPIDGVVLEKNVEPGSSIKPGDAKPLFRLTSTAHITAQVNIAESDALAVKTGDKVTVAIQALHGQPAIEAKITRVAPAITRGQGTLSAEILLPNPDGQLKPGMTGMARIVVGEIADALTIPQSAVYQILERRMCVRVVKGRMLQTPVKLGIESGDVVQILEGLSQDDIVAVAIGKVPPDGQLVEPVPAQADD